ncbi:small heat shock protein, chloroplastic [Typha angustifolia]|uniref:small heat shock protein, chloroplastic n=1 Tax=Typha angustifolia TaxID=59011 RepID=UPI003C2C781A
MASIIISRRVPFPKLLEKLLSSPIRPASASSAFRSFNTNTQLRDYDDGRLDEVDRSRSDSDVTRRRGESPFPSVFSDVFDPFNPTRSLSQVLNLMDQMLDNPFLTAARGTGGIRRGWEAKEDKEALYLRVDMPGLGKDQVKVWAEQNTLVIKGEGEKESDEEESRRRYSSRIDLPPDSYRMDQIKAEMKNGVLKVVLPKVKEDERKDVFQVKIE